MARCIVAVDCADHSSALSRLFRVMEDSMKELVRNGGGGDNRLQHFMCGSPLSFVRPRRGPLVGFLKSPTPRLSLSTSRRMTLKFKPITVPRKPIPPHHETMNLPLYFVLLVPLGGQEVLETLTEPVVPFRPDDW